MPAAAMLIPLPDGSNVDVRFDGPQRAVTPGQAAVFYDEDLVLGGGWIE
jgi:tRNA-specific 2-thiouridylase